MAAVDPSYQFLACQYLREQLEVLMRELHGVRRNEEIEPVHQARVASRRVRAALSMFADCFKTKKAAQWPKRIKKLTRELGAARDKDVQIEFVEGFLAALDGKDRKHRPGVERLLLRLRQGRRLCSRRSLPRSTSWRRPTLWRKCTARWKRALFTLRSHGARLSSPFVLEATRAHIRRQEGGPDGLCAVAGRSRRTRAAITKCGSPPRSCATRWRSPIAAYEGRLADFIDAFKQVQSLLGDVHDCDVWVRASTNSWNRSGWRRSSTSATDRPFSRLKPGLLLVCEDRGRIGGRSSARLLEYWKGLDAEHFWESLAIRWRLVEGMRPGAVRATGQRPMPKKKKTKRIALLSDVHGNLPALEAVLDDAADKRRRRTVVLRGFPGLCTVSQ